MSSVVLVEQRLPFIIMLASRASTYIYIVISLFAVLLFWAFPSWKIAKPPAREITRKRRSSSVTSTSSTSTLVNSNEDVPVKKDAVEPEKTKHHRVSFSSKIPFNKLNSSVKDAISRGKAIKPKLPRRLTLPARRFSTHVVGALQNLTPHHRKGQDCTDSYFSTVEAKAKAENADVTMAGGEGDTPVSSRAAPIAISVSITRTTKVEKIEGDKGAITQNESYITVETAQRKRTFKQFARRASAVILGDMRVHRP